jgi:hypothetical protein
VSEKAGVPSELFWFVLFLLVVAVMVAGGSQLQLGDWKRMGCTRDGAVLVADTLCVRRDSVWRLVEPSS